MSPCASGGDESGRGLLVQFFLCSISRFREACTREPRSLASNAITRTAVVVVRMVVVLAMVLVVVFANQARHYHPCKKIPKPYTLNPKP